MSLRVWLPLTKDLRQQGLSNVTVTNNGATYSATNGKLGGCYVLDGSNDRIQISNLPQPQNISVAMWFKRGANTNTRQFLFTAWNGITLELSTSGTVTCSVATTDGQVGYCNTNTAITTSTGWTHICFTFENGVGTKLYINGVFQTATAVAKPISWSTTTGNIGYFSTYLNASVNDFRLYDHALSQMEVKELAKGLVLHYPLDRQGWGQENLYTTSQDFSGSWNNKSNWTTSEETYQNFIVKQKSTVWGGLSQNIPCSNGDIFTISFYAKVDVGGRICSVHRSSLGNVTTGLTILGGNFISGTDWVNATNDGIQWKRYWATVRIDSSDITYLQWRIENSIADKTLYICGMKMERGSIATPWCPNSSDALATTMGLNSTIEYDCSGFCNNGTRTGTFTWTSDTPKYAVSTNFSTISQHIYLNYDTNGFKDSYSISLWLKYNSTQINASPEIFGIPAYACLFISSNLIYWNTNDGTSNPFKNNGSTLSITPYVNSWHHFVITGNGTNVILYIDGVEAGRATTYKHFGGTKIVLSDKDNTRNTFSFIGLASDFRIYATALSADDVKSLYQNCATIDPDGTIRGQIRS